MPNIENILKGRQVFLRFTSIRQWFSRWLLRCCIPLAPPIPKILLQICETSALHPHQVKVYEKVLQLCVDNVSSTDLHLYNARFMSVGLLGFPPLSVVAVTIVLNPERFSPLLGSTIHNPDTRIQNPLTLGIHLLSFPHSSQYWSSTQTGTSILMS